MKPFGRDGWWTQRWRVCFVRSRSRNNSLVRSPSSNNGGYHRDRELPMPKPRVIKGHIRKLDPTTAYLPVSEEDIAPQPAPLTAHFKKGRKGLAILDPGDPEFAR